MEVGIVYYIALASIFVIGVILGGVVVFFARRMLITRQIRIAERKAARIMTESRLESKNVLSEAKQDAEEATNGKVDAKTSQSLRGRVINMGTGEVVLVDEEENDGAT